MLSQILFGLIFMVVVFIACAVIMVFLSFILPRSPEDGQMESEEAESDDELVPRGASPEVTSDEDAEEHTSAVG